MKLSGTEYAKARERFLKTLWNTKSIPFHVMKTTMNRRSWEEGITTDELLDVLKVIFKRKTRPNKVYIIQVISNIKRFDVPGLYVVSKVGKVFNESTQEYRREFRYFNLRDPSDADEVRDKLDGDMHLKRLMAVSLENHMSEIDVQTKPVLKETQTIEVRQ